MTSSATALLQAIRTDLPFIIKFAFLLYVLLSFIAVTMYTARKVRAGRLIDGRRAPTRLNIPPRGEWLILPNLVVLPFMQSGLYVATILSALAFFFIATKRSGRAPTLMPQAAGWLFVLNVLNLLLLHSPYYMILVMVGISFLILEMRRTADEQFGFARLSIFQLLRWSLLICGAVIAIEAPLTEILEVVFTAVHLPHPQQESVETFRQFTDPGQIAAFMILAVFISPMVEEIFFRGFLLTFLKNYTTTWLALVLSAGVFAVAHVNLASAIPLWLLGIVLGVAYEHTGSLLLPIGIHACFNLVTALSLLLDKANP